MFFEYTKKPELMLAKSAVPHELNSKYPNLL